MNRYSIVLATMNLYLSFAFFATTAGCIAISLIRAEYLATVLSVLGFLFGSLLLYSCYKDLGTEIKRYNEEFKKRFGRYPHDKTYLWESTIVANSLSVRCCVATIQTELKH